MREKAVKDDISAKTVPIWFHHTVFTVLQILFRKCYLHNPTPTLMQVGLMNWSPLPTRPPNTSTCLPLASLRRWRSSGTGKLQGLAMSRNQIFTKIFRRKFRATNIFRNFKHFFFNETRFYGIFEIFFCFFFFMTLLLPGSSWSTTPSRSAESTPPAPGIHRTI